MEEEQLRHEVCAVEQVPGLYITDWVGASSVNEVNILNVTHILTVLSAGELDQYGPDETEGVELRHLSLKDEASENIIQYFDQECEWLDRVLKGGIVLVHCQQGISRSIAIVVAFLMRKLGISFDKAFAIVRKSRSIVNMNEGFCEQLKLWEQCRYSIFLELSASGKDDGQKKPAYLAWERNRASKIESSVGRDGRTTPTMSPSVISPKTPVREVEATDMIDFLDAETG